MMAQSLQQALRVTSGDGHGAQTPLKTRRLGRMDTAG